MKAQAIVVLSGGITKSGKVPFFVKERLNHAYRLFHYGASSRITVCGYCSYLYKGRPPCSEADAMARYLKSLGVPDKNIYLEEKSFDLISSAYYLKKKYLSPRRLHNIHIIASDFQEERTRYVFEKVLGPTYTTSYTFTHSRLQPTLLWEVFIHERKSLLKTRAYLKDMKVGDHEYLKKNFFNSTFYKKKYSGQLRMLVPEGRIGKPTNVKRLYSLRNIFKKRKEIFAKYELTEAKLIRKSKADFWSGRFLNFFGKDKDGAYYSLKFALLPKDKRKLKKEFRVSEFLKKNAVTFVPTVIDGNFEKAPIWYLYKIVSGRISGQFSIEYSFGEYFYRDFVIDRLAGHLKKMREVRSDRFRFISWRSGLYKKFFDQNFKKTKRYKTIASSSVLEQAKKYFDNNTSLFDWASLYVSHNDLHPANIIISTSKKKLYFIDFEHVGYNNTAFDFCFFYLFSWDNPDFQKKLRKAFVESLTTKEKDEFKVLFPLVLCFFCVWFLHFIEHWSDRAGPERYAQAKKYVFSELTKLVSE